jgi:hypothetical protein
VVVTPTEKFGGSPTFGSPGDWTPTNYLPHGQTLQVDCVRFVDKYAVAHVATQQYKDSWIDIHEIRGVDDSKASKLPLHECS